MGCSGSRGDDGGRLKVSGSLVSGGRSRCDDGGRHEGVRSANAGGSSRLGSGWVDGSGRTSGCGDSNLSPFIDWSPLAISSTDACRSSLDNINRVRDGGMASNGGRLFDCGTDDGWSMNTGSTRLNRGPTEDVAMNPSRDSRQPIDTLHSSGSTKEAL